MVPSESHVYLMAVEQGWIKFLLTTYHEYVTIERHFPKEEDVRSEMMEIREERKEPLAVTVQVRDRKDTHKHLHVEFTSSKRNTVTDMTTLIRADIIYHL